MAGAVAVVAGATGLVGRELVRQLAADTTWSEVRALVRRPLPLELMAPRVVVVEVDYAHLDGSALWARADHVFCALGTTLRRAGSRAAFRQVDYEYPLALARSTLAQAARQFLLVSSAGADPGSRMFYPRVKGELETAIAALGFRSVTIARPSLLLGLRAERRLGEEVWKLLGVFAPAAWRPVPAARVAGELVAAAKQELPGVRILENRAIRATAAHATDMTAQLPPRD